ncbi:MAG: cobaltochelatase subunit CobN [Planctomycetota bacterium]
MFPNRDGAAGVRILRLLVPILLLLPALARGQGRERPRITFFGLHGGVFAELARQAERAGVSVTELSYEDLAAGKADLRVTDCLLVQHLRAEVQEALADCIVEARRLRPGFPALMLTARSPPALTSRPEHQGLLACDPGLGPYYATSRDNLRRLLRYVAIRYCGAEGEVEEPEQGIRVGFFHPDLDGIVDLDGILAFLRGPGPGAAPRPRIAVAVHSIHLQFQQPAVVTALIRRLERKGFAAAAIIDDSEGLGDQRGRYQELLKGFAPELVIHTCHSRDDVPFRLELDVPHLHSMFFRKKSIEEWRASTEGVDARDVAFHVVGQEPLGAIEPHACAGTLLGDDSGESFVPVEDRIDRIVRRAAGWVRLRRKPNADKRVAVFYWDRDMGRSGLMRGSATGMYLNAPRSMVRLLTAMRDAGYAVPRPPDEDDLVEAMLDHGRQVPVHDPEVLDRLVREGDPVLIPVDRYRAWLERRVPEARRKELEAKWGPAPGRFMVWKDDEGREFLVVPVLRYGAVTLLPQPMRGEAHDSRSAHDRTTCPPHQYLATYLWLEEELGADAVVHFGTHGSEFTLPGKDVGLASDDWCDLLLGDLPNVQPWIVENLGEAAPAKRRVYAVLVGHQPPPLMKAGLGDDLARLHEAIEKWETLADGALREKFRAEITREVRAQHLDVDLGLDVPAAGIDDETIARVDGWLHEVLEERVPDRLHVLGEPPRREDMVRHLVCCLRQGFTDAVAALLPPPAGLDHDLALAAPDAKAAELVAGVVERGLTPLEAARAAGLPDGVALPEAVAKGLRQAAEMAAAYAETGREVTGVLDALAGRFVPAGPGRGPDRNPGVLPTGRNLYMLSPDEVPSRPSWELGKELADSLLAAQRAELGRWPRKVAFSLSSFATFQDYGVMEAQVLRCLGVEPIWNEKGLVHEFRIVPLEELGRPRVDVFLASLSYYRDNFPSRMRYLDGVIRAVAALAEGEDDNYVRADSLRAEEALLAQGEPPSRARKLARARLFGYAPGQRSDPGYYYLVERSGDWDTRDELMDVYMARVSHVYGDDLWGEPARAAYEQALQGSDVVLRTWYDSMTSPLSNKYTWYTGGSLALAIEKVTGRRPGYVLTDIRDPDRGTLVDAEAAVRRDLHTRLFNRRFLEGLEQEGYAGADQVAVHVKNLYGWEIMRKGSITADVWERVVEVFLEDSLELGTREWFERDNPYALQELVEVLLEVARKGYWDPGPERLRQLAEVLTDSIAEHGPAGGIFEAGKGKTRAYAEAALGVALASAEAGPAEVEGRVLEQVTPTVGPAWWAPLLALGGVLVLVAVGFARGPGGVR